MPTDPKPQKPMPSADEINAYLEASAARTKLRLPLAKGNALAVAPSPAPNPAEKSQQRALPVSGSKKLPTGREEVRRAEGDGGAPQSNTEKSGADASSGEAWRPFSDDDDR